MARYGVNKPLLMNEGGVLCHPLNTTCPNDTFRQDQAIGMVKLMARTWANDIEGSIWYTLNGPGWREGGLLKADGTPLPAYTSLAFMSEKLKTARFIKSIGIAPIEGYEFEDSSRIYRLYWTNSISQPGLIPVPSGTSRGVPTSMVSPYPRWRHHTHLHDAGDCGGGQVDVAG